LCGVAKDKWTDFFLKYQDRIIYGTDIGSNTLDDECKEPDALVHVVKGFFTQCETICEFGDRFSPMPLPKKVLEKIFSSNMLKLCNGDTPKAICNSAIFPEIAFEENYGAKTPLALQNLEALKRAFDYVKPSVDSKLGK